MIDAFPHCIESPDTPEAPCSFQVPYYLPCSLVTCSSNLGGLWRSLSKHAIVPLALAYTISSQASTEKVCQRVFGRADGKDQQQMGRPALK